MATPPQIGRTIAESTPAYPTLRRPPSDAPNVLVVLLDDTGFAQFGCFGSDIETPTFYRLARDVLRYQRFHVTALCSPTRAALLTGRNHHSVGMGFLTDVPTGFPGYSGRIPESAATLPRILRDAGYSTMALGKWHIAPRWDQHQSGPFDRWPLGLGFERFYGFPAGDTNQWAPNLIRDNTYVDPPRTPEEGYHLNEDLADEAIRMITEQQESTPHRPFFTYFAPGAMHAPHHAPPDWIERYRGRFDEGWDRWRDRVFARQVAEGVVPPDTELTPRPEGMAAWDDLPPEEQRLYARQMEVFAGFLSHTDHHLGRVIDFLDELGILDDTIVMVCTDNGASAEGGAHGSFNEHSWALGQEDDVEISLARIDELGGHRSYGHYSWGWAWAGNTPFRMWKRYTWLGGVRTPLIVHWPRGIPARSRGEVRGQFCHAIDLAPTVLDAAGVDAPVTVGGVDQMPLHGASLVPSFTDADAPARSTQYFEMLGSRAIVDGRWKATTDHLSQGVPDEDVLTGSRDFDTDRWSLFDLEADFAEARDLAATEPEIVRRLEELWWREAGRFQVLPLDDTLTGRVVAMEPSPHPPRYRWTYRPGVAVAEEATPSLAGGFRLTVAVDPLARDDSGVLGAQGDWSNGWALVLRDGRPTFFVSRYGEPFRIEAEHAAPVGTTALGVEYAREEPGGGAVRLLADGEVIGEGRIPRDLPFRWQIGGARLHLGLDRGFPVSEEYRVPFAFTGTVRTATFELPYLAFLEDRVDPRASLATD
ncbi:MAG: arylsulfatase [Actinomycetota bacterium]